MEFTADDITSMLRGCVRPEACGKWSDVRPCDRLWPKCLWHAATVFGVRCSAAPKSKPLRCLRMPKKADKSGATSPGYEERLRGAPGLAEVLVILKEAATSNSDPQKGVESSWVAKANSLEHSSFRHSVC